MNPNKPIYHLALLCLEAETSHGIHSDIAEFIHDVVLLRDANGLPALPGTSIAGVLRHLYTEQFGKDSANELFGYADKDQGRSSDVNFTWGLIHNSKDIVIEGLQKNLQDDEILNALSQKHPITRDRVRLDARGAALDTGKFDVSLIPAGVRYSTLIGYWSDGSEAKEQAWQDLLALLYSPLFRLGHGTRSGAGAFKVHALHVGRWDLRNLAEKDGYIQRPRTRMDARRLPSLVLDSEQSQHALRLELNLKSESGWRIGGGSVPIGFPHESMPDLLPQTEWRIEWQGNKASVGARKYLAPASAIKGALLHRFAFHYRCLNKDWVVNEPKEAHDESAVQALFGSAGNKDDEGAAGLVFIDDMYLDAVKTTVQMHNKIDQFTAGVMTGALFEEGLLWQTSITLNVQLHNNARLQALGSKERQALAYTVDDLCAGRLPIGAGGSRGLGVFIATNEPKWSDNGQWIMGE